MMQEMQVMMEETGINNDDQENDDHFLSCLT